MAEVDRLAMASRMPTECSDSLLKTCSADLWGYNRIGARMPWWVQASCCPASCQLMQSSVLQLGTESMGEAVDSGRKTHYVTCPAEPLHHARAAQGRKRSCQAAVRCVLTWHAGLPGAGSQGSS